jgi:hypothetical protein
VTYPRILLISASALEGKDATSITISSLFSGWPQGKLRQIVALSQIDVVKKSKFEWRAIDTKDIFTLLGKALPINISTSIYGASAGKRTLVNKMVSTIKAIRELKKELFCKDTLSWIEEYQPELIYSVGGSLCWCQLACRLADKLRIPVIFHFMDDWPTTLFRNAMFHKQFRSIASDIIRNALDKGPFHLTISADMAAEYNQRYNKEFRPFMRCLNYGPTRLFDKSESNKPIRLVFVGSLHLGRWKVLRDIGKALEHMGRADISADIYLPFDQIKQYSDLVNGPRHIKFVGHVEPGREQRVLSSYDAAIHVESFDPQVADYTRLSISTKLPLYFSVGLPVLAVGPGQLSSIKWISTNRAGIVVDSLEITKIAAAIELLTCPQKRGELGEAAFSAFKHYHEATTVRKGFAEALNAVATTKK